MSRNKKNITPLDKKMERFEDKIAEYRESDLKSKQETAVSAPTGNGSRVAIRRRVKIASKSWRKCSVARLYLWAALQPVLITAGLITVGLVTIGLKTTGS